MPTSSAEAAAAAILAQIDAATFIETGERLLEQDARGRQVTELSEQHGEVVAVRRNLGVVVAVGLAVGCERLLE